MLRVARSACYGAIILGLLWSGWVLVQAHQVHRWQTRIEYYQASDATLQWPLFGGVSNADAPSFLACYQDKYKWQASYYAFASEAYLSQGLQLRADRALTYAYNAAMKRVACHAADAKAWLDLARISLEREGYSTATERALVQSFTLSPNEVWLAEMRIPFWLQFVPIAYEADVRAAFEKDVDTIERGFVWRKQRLYQSLGVSDKTELLQP